MKVAVVYSEVKREYFPTETQYLTEKDALNDAKVIATYVKNMGNTPLLFPGDAQLAENLNNTNPGLVINLVGSVRGKEYLSAAIPGLLEILDLPFTGARFMGEALSFNKYLILKLLEKNDVPVARYQLIVDYREPLKTTLRFPLISKLNEIHGAVEIDQDAVSENEDHLRKRLKKLIATYRQPILVQEFIPGREITGIFFEGLGQEVFLAEKKFSSPDKKFVFATFEHQWLDREETFHYQKYHDDKLNHFIRKAFFAAKMADYGKFDVRLNPAGEYFFIDANSNPAFGPKELQCALGTILDMYGVSFEEILKVLLAKHQKK